MSGNAGINKFAMLMQERMIQVGKKPLVLDFGEIMPDYSLKTNTFGLNIPVEDYLICRSVSYDPRVPLTMTWWKDEGWTADDWNSKEKQPQEWTQNSEPKEYLDHWGELINPGSKLPYWDEKHKKPPIIGADHVHGPKGEHSHDEDDDGKHYHDVYLPKKMRCIRPGDRVLVAWVGNDAVVVDIILLAEEVL